MILDDPSQWDNAALKRLMGYKPRPKQVRDNAMIEGPWLSVMRNSLNAQIWSFKHPNSLAISATHGSPHLALYDKTIWDKYQLSKVASENF